MLASSAWWIGCKREAYGISSGPSARLALCLGLPDDVPQSLEFEAQGQYTGINRGVALPNLLPLSHLSEISMLQTVRLAYRIVAVLVSMPLFCCGLDEGSLIANDGKAQIDFNRDIRPILSNHCFRCHGPDEEVRSGGGSNGLRLDSPSGILEDLGGYSAVVPGKPDESHLILRVTSQDASELMPPPEVGPKLAEAEVDLLRRWIQQGAHYSVHWAYVAPQRPPIPELKTEAARRWAQTPIDHFILERLDRDNIGPQPLADPHTLIRRVALDVTGLPPSWDEVQQFVDDTGPDAYEKMVDRQLAKESYGEHWARMWLDLARYADSAGYADDPARTIWAYRDYVIKAFNQNMPFDQFTIEQIAGDLLPLPTSEQLIATAFHRNTLTNNEGGTNDEEFRNVAVVDRVNTTYAVWMGTTMACAQCHSHKYDPLTQEEYFQSFALFNNSEDADRGDESPLHEVWSESQLQARQRLQQGLTEGQEILDRMMPEQNLPLRDFYRNIAPKLEEVRQRMTKQRAELAALKPTTTVPIMRQLPADRQRLTKVQNRGNFLDLGAEVKPDIPGIFRVHDADVGDRLGFAKWLVSRDNPLTARVTVNRYWEQLFGTGLVATAEEFGSQGDLPTHPELLDWLAVELMDSGWNMKQLLKLMLMSATYRQSSKVTHEMAQSDPENRLLARGPRFRLPAETIRDQALAVAGLLSHKMYGPPVKPPQPTLGLAAAFGSSTDWQTSDGEDRYRRGIYTTWRRSNPYPSMSTFDAPNREVCTLRRLRTNTPLQALVTLNDPVYIEAAQAFGRAMIQEAGNLEQKLELALSRALTRPVRSEEVGVLRQLYDQSLVALQELPEQAAKLATDPTGPVPENIPVVELAAWTVVANSILNLDEFLMRR